MGADYVGLLDRFRSPTQEIIGIPLKIKSGSDPLPSPMVGAYVTAFSIAGDPQVAVKQSVLAIFAMGYDVEEVIPKAMHISLNGWADYVTSAWPEFLDHFPSQKDIAARLANGGVVFSPFAGFDEPSAA